MARVSGRPRSAPTNISEALDNFKHHESVDFRLNCASDLASSRRNGDMFIAGEMFAEAATDNSLDILEKQTLLHKGKELWEEVYSMGKQRLGGLDRFAGQAAVKLALFPSTQWLVAGERLAPLPQTEADYESLLDTGQELISSWQKTNDTGTRAHLAGSIAETNVQLLLMRFVLAHQDSEYLSLFSFLSEDQAGSRGSARGARWDISVFTQYAQEQAPDLRHRVQVKSGRNALKPGYEYDDSVQIVCVRDDLALGKRSIRHETIIEECAREASGETGDVVERLDQRTQKLLDLI